jgi:hypothetical protein
MNDISNAQFKNNKNAEFPIINNDNINNTIKYNDNELNRLPYEKAFIIDKRKYFDY